MKKTMRLSVATLFALQCSSIAWAADWQNAAPPPAFQPVNTTVPTSAPAPAPPVVPTPVPGVTPPTAPTANPTGSTTTPKTTTNADPLNPTFSIPSANQSAEGGKGSNSSAGAIAQAVGTGLIAQGTAMLAQCGKACPSCCAIGAMLMGMGMLGMAQSGGNKSTAGQHGSVAGVTTSGDYGTGSSEDPYTQSSSGVETFKPSADTLKQLASKGITFDPKSGDFKLPDGKSFNLKDVNNPNSMANAGVNPIDYAKVMDIASGLEKKAAAEVEKVGAHTASSGFSEGGGGGYGGGRSPSGSSDSSGGGVSYVARANDPKPNLAGMTRNYNGEMIGVAGDSIFDMMARRYQQKSKEQTFLPPEARPN